MRMRKVNRTVSKNFLYQQRYANRHNQVISILASTEFFTDIPFIKAYADLPNFYADDTPRPQKF